MPVGDPSQWISILAHLPLLSKTGFLGLIGALFCGIWVRFFRGSGWMLYLASSGPRDTVQFRLHKGAGRRFGRRCEWFVDPFPSILVGEKIPVQQCDEVGERPVDAAARHPLLHSEMTFGKLMWTATGINKEGCSGKSVPADLYLHQIRFFGDGGFFDFLGVFVR
jgi:hypothetical protein